jgi:pyridoxine 5-phosphate synthase
MKMAPRLSVNLNKVALLRNSRHTGVPDLLKFAALVREAGADGITVHPRPDERHIRRDDVLKLAEWMAPWRPTFELNVEGFPDDRLMEIVRIVRPEQCTLVPDDPNVLTSEEGWKLDNHDSQIVASAVPAFQREGCRVILLAALPPVAEASIGHELTADALVVGFPNAIRAYKAALEGAPIMTPAR